MTLVKTDGFDMYNGTATLTGLQSKWSALIGITNVSMVTGRFGGQAVHMGSAANGVARNLTAARSSGAHGFACRVTSMPTSDSSPWLMFALLSSGTYTLGLRCKINGAIEAFRATSGAAGTSLGVSAAGVIVANTWHYWEFEYVISDSVGRVTVWVDGVQILNITGADTNNGVTTVDQFGIVNLNGTPATQFDVDDWYEADAATRIGEGKVETLRGASDGTVTWTPNSGANNYSRINETTVDTDTTYAETGTLNNQDLYNFGPLSSTPSAIYGAQLVSFDRKTDAGSRSIALVAKSGGTTDVGGDYALSASYGRFERMLVVDPNTSAAWTAAAVNALQSGPKVTV